MLAASEIMATNFLPSMKDFLCYSEDGWIINVQACLAVMAVGNIHSVHACHTVYTGNTLVQYKYCHERMSTQKQVSKKGGCPTGSSTATTVPY